MNGNWHGITYPRWLQNRLVWRLWRRFCCPRGWHLLDEYQSGGSGVIEWGLTCDACDIDVNIGYIPAGGDE